MKHIGKFRSPLRITMENACGRSLGVVRRSIEKERERAHHSYTRLEIKIRFWTLLKSFWRAIKKICCSSSRGSRESKAINGEETERVGAKE